MAMNRKVLKVYTQSIERQGWVAVRNQCHLFYIVRLFIKEMYLCSMRYDAKFFFEIADIWSCPELGLVRRELTLRNT